MFRQKKLPKMLLIRKMLLNLKKEKQNERIRNLKMFQKLTRKKHRQRISRWKSKNTDCTIYNLQKR